MTQISTIREIQSWSIDFNGLEKVLAEYCKEQKIDLAVSGRSLKSRFLLLLEEIATDKKEYETFVQYYKSTDVSYRITCNNGNQRTLINP